MIEIESKPGTNAEYANYASVVALPGIDVFSARFVGHRFGPHTHDTWSLGAIRRGAQDSAARVTQHHVACAGELTAIPPGEVHAGRLASSGPLEYSMLYIPDEELRRRAAELNQPHVEPAQIALAAPTLATQLDAFVQLALQPQTDALTVQAEWYDLISGLLSRYAGTELREKRSTHSSQAMLRALECLHDHWNQSISLDQLAQEAAMAPTYFCRQFAKTYGLAPHRYQTVLRVNRAKTLLKTGVAIADVAAATGFADQSHLGRHLKGCLGVTPGELARLAPKARTF